MRSQPQQPPTLMQYGGSPVYKPAGIMAERMSEASQVSVQQQQEAVAAHYSHYSNMMSAFFFI